MNNPMNHYLLYIFSYNLYIKSLEHILYTLNFQYLNIYPCKGSYAHKNKAIQKLKDSELTNSDSDTSSDE